MRTTVRLDDELMTQVKRYAARHRQTVTSVLEDSLRQLLERERRRGRARPVDVVVFTGSGLREGIDLNDRATWGEVLEAEDVERFRAVTDVDA